MKKYVFVTLIVIVCFLNAFGSKPKPINQYVVTVNYVLENNKIKIKKIIYKKESFLPSATVNLFQETKEDMLNKKEKKRILKHNVEKAKLDNALEKKDDIQTKDEEYQSILLSHETYIRINKTNDSIKIVFIPVDHEKKYFHEKYFSKGKLVKEVFIEDEKIIKENIY